MLETWSAPTAFYSGCQEFRDFDAGDGIGNGGVEQDVAGGVCDACEDVAYLALFLTIAIFAAAVGDLRQAGQRRNRSVDQPQHFAESDIVGRTAQQITSLLAALSTIPSCFSSKRICSRNFFGMA